MHRYIGSNAPKVYRYVPFVLPGGFYIYSCKASVNQLFCFFLLFFFRYLLNYGGYFGGTHVEVVTKVNRGQVIFDDDFCSRGAGRAWGSNMGTEICEGWNPFSSKREIDNDNIRFLRVF